MSEQKELLPLLRALDDAQQRIEAMVRSTQWTVRAESFPGDHRDTYIRGAIAMARSMYGDQPWRTVDFRWQGVDSVIEIRPTDSVEEVIERLRKAS